MADTLAAHMLQLWPATAAGQDGRGHAGAVDLHRAEVHQATGVLSVRLGVPLSEALARLRAEAYSSGRTLADMARAIIARELPP